MIAAPARVGAVGIDLDTALQPADVARIIALEAPEPRISFVIRYLGDLTQGEAEIITGAGLALMPVSHPRGGAIDADYGKLDGEHAVQRAAFAQIPTGTTVWLDFESWTGTAADGAAYVNAWAHVIQGAGFVAGLYVGACATPLTPDQLRELAVTAYWHSCSEVPDVAGIGFQMVQLFPPNQLLAGLQVDFDIIQRDYKNRIPTWAVASPREAPTLPGRKSSGSMRAVSG